MNNISAAVLAAAAGLVVTGASGFTVIPFLRKVNFGKITEGFEQKWFKSRINIPSMGGIMIVLGTAAAVAAVIVTDKLTGGDIIASGSFVPQEMYTKFWSGLMTAGAFALAGAVDDYAKIINNSSLGLTVSRKYAAMFLIALSFLLSSYLGMQGEPYMFIPFAGMTATGLFYWILGMIFIPAYVNSVNLADGIDGLCAVNSLMTCVFLGIASALRENYGALILCVSLAGASTGFLLWNKKVRAGSIGSLFIGGVTAAIAYSLGCPLMLILCGASYSVIGICEIIRVIYYRINEKRLFKAYPLQFHFKECGTKEGKIIGIFIIVDIIGGVASLVLLKAGGFFG